MQEQYWMHESPNPIKLAECDALLVTDLQNDFLSGGTLAVSGGDRVILPINRLIALFKQNMLAVFATRDWHPEKHCSFKEQGGPWSSHCVSGTYGARFSQKIKFPESVEVVSKATRPDEEAYSSFEGTDLLKRLRERNIKRVFVVGLTTEYCIHDSAKDAVRLGLNAIVLTDAIASISQDPELNQRVLSDMAGAGVTLAKTTDIVGYQSFLGASLTQASLL